MISCPFNSPVGLTVIWDSCAALICVQSLIDICPCRLTAFQPGIQPRGAFLSMAAGMWRLVVVSCPYDSSFQVLRESNHLLTVAYLSSYGHCIIFSEFRPASVMCSQPNSPRFVNRASCCCCSCYCCCTVYHHHHYYQLMTSRWKKQSNCQLEISFTFFCNARNMPYRANKTCLEYIYNT